MILLVVNMGRAEKIKRNVAVKKNAFAEKQHAWKRNILSMEDNGTYGIDIGLGKIYQSGAFWKEYYKKDLV